MKIDFLCPCPCSLCINYAPKKIIKRKQTPSCYLGEWIDEGYILLVKMIHFNLF